MANTDGIQGPQPQTGTYRHLIGFAAEGADGRKVGTVKAVWEDEAGRLAYLGIATGWLGLGRIHVIPAWDAEVSEHDNLVRMPFTEHIIATGPDFEADYEITPEGERLIGAYYRDQGTEADADFNPDPGDPSLYTGHDSMDQDPGRNPGQSPGQMQGGTQGGAQARARDPDSPDPARSEWHPRTDAPMAYGEAIGEDPGMAAPDRSLAERERIEETEERNGIQGR